GFQRSARSTLVFSDVKHAGIRTAYARADTGGSTWTDRRDHAGANPGGKSSASVAGIGPDFIFLYSVRIQFGLTRLRIEQKIARTFIFYLSMASGPQRKGELTKATI